MNSWNYYYKASICLNTAVYQRKTFQLFVRSVYALLNVQFVCIQKNQSSIRVLQNIHFISSRN